jgi:hypothetical protein
LSVAASGVSFGSKAHALAGAATGPLEASIGENNGTALAIVLELTVPRRLS